jgi:hypothetical protein
MSRLPAPPREVPCIARVEVLAPKFQDAVRRILERMAQLGLKARVVETMRTDARQQYLYGFGRDYDDDRGVVTQSDSAFTTWHGYGLAVDMVWGAPTTFWEALARLALAEGLTSGADWNRNGLHDEKFCDRPHVQWYCPGMHVAPSDHARALVEQGGIEAVWKELGAL